MTLICLNNLSQVRDPQWLSKHSCPALLFLHLSRLNQCPAEHINFTLGLVLPVSKSHALISSEPTEAHIFWILWQWPVNLVLLSLMVITSTSLDTFTRSSSKRKLYDDMPKITGKVGFNAKTQLGVCVCVCVCVCVFIHCDFVA